MLIHAYILSARLLLIATYTRSVTNPDRAKLMALLRWYLCKFDTNVCSILDKKL
jgi:hypothetical protein